MRKYKFSAVESYSTYSNRGRTFESHTAVFIEDPAGIFTEDEAKDFVRGGCSADYVELRNLDGEVITIEPDEED